ncbi:hypothetical protein E1A91_A12G261300v1 [Gossypium mustelinum]|uniref:Uncharacterized protein n=1 Tax=Gossypium mustelinum TaxID=34275 RepID=A0A5D2WYY1_GOSMU|nr:hypothetical protein E1A91_A12G261300v1 [Gossypium mustelinum]
MHQHSMQLSKIQCNPSILTISHINFSQTPTIPFEDSEYRLQFTCKSGNFEARKCFHRKPRCVDKVKPNSRVLVGSNS